MRRLKKTGADAPADIVSTELIDRCKSGDQQAWTELVEATHREVYTLCLRILGNPDDAAEATQDVYVKIWRGLQGFRGDAMFSTWLYRVASNTAISKHRSRARRRTHESSADDEALAAIPSGASVENAAEARVEVRVLEQALGTMPEIYRQAVVLRDVYGFSIEEIAKQVGISQTATKVRVHRGRKMLKHIVFPSDGEDRDEM